MKLTATNVKATVLACLYDDADVIGGKLRDGAPEPIKVHSVMMNAGFNSVKAQTESIKAMLNELSLDFFPTEQGGGGGMPYISINTSAVAEKLAA